MPERVPLTPDSATKLGAAAGLQVPLELAAGVAARLNGAAAEAEAWRPAVGQDAKPFRDFELPPAPTRRQAR
ncbi:MAG TPA: hypothetical protein VFN07_09290, partial [Trueperaceae bacterium]|nr:hypothetical protein [Trueperaceae bacterium]